MNNLLAAQFLEGVMPPYSYRVEPFIVKHVGVNIDNFGHSKSGLVDHSTLETGCPAMKFAKKV